MEATPDSRGGRLILRDPTQLAAGMLVVGQEQLLILSLCDGRHARREIQAEFARQTGDILLGAELDHLLEQLDGAGYLEGPGFDRYYGGLVEAYRAGPHRPLRDPDSYGAPAAELPRYLNGLMESSAREPEAPPPAAGRLAGLIAPHLDFPRGKPCYGGSYHHLRSRLDPAPRRVVVLGTNHFGRSQSVVGTLRDFQTPWGVVPTDREFAGRLQAECGGNLMPYELDHLHEHSIELQAIWLHHVLGDGFRVVPYLCPDPSGPNGTQAGDPEGVDLREFAAALGRLVREDPEPTLIIASADLSHIGGYFGDERELTPAWLGEVGESDKAALRWVDAHDPEGFRQHMAATGNPTRICSVGCIYALMVALHGEAEPTRLRYHQAVTHKLKNAVTCAAYAYYR